MRLSRPTLIATGILASAAAVVLAYEAGHRRKRVVLSPLVVAGCSGIVVTRISGREATSEFRPQVGIVRAALANGNDVLALMKLGSRRAV